MVFNFSLEEFYEHKPNWVLYRGLGHLNESGIFVPPLSYTEAQQLPKRKMEMFIELDELAAKKLRALKKKQKGKS